MPKNDWNAYRELFLHEMKENGKQFNHVATALEDLSKEIALMKVDIGALKVKAALAGGVAGMVGTGAMTLLISMLK